MFAGLRLGPFWEILRGIPDPIHRARRRQLPPLQQLRMIAGFGLWRVLFQDKS